MAITATWKARREPSPNLTVKIDRNSLYLLFELQDDDALKGWRA